MLLSALHIAVATLVLRVNLWDSSGFLLSLSAAVSTEGSHCHPSCALAQRVSCQPLWGCTLGAAHVSDLYPSDVGHRVLKDQSKGQSRKVVSLCKPVCSCPPKLNQPGSKQVLGWTRIGWIQTYPGDQPSLSKWRCRDTTEQISGQGEIPASQPDKSRALECPMKGGSEQ